MILLQPFAWRSVAGRWIALCLPLALCLSCTAGSDAALRRKLDGLVKIDEVLFKETDYLTCTYAHLRIDSTSLHLDAAAATQASLTTLRREQAIDPRSDFVYPAGGVAVFEASSVFDVLSALHDAGDGDLSRRIGWMIDSAKSCLQSGTGSSRRHEREALFETLKRQEGVVAFGQGVGQGSAGFLVVIFPTSEEAYYFGP